ncbi:hypothetical protein MIND_01185500 [Mycena indigotica]|uniref:Uncharacterized protein n=1 Tax=Mycena indigotica TaxID=2126181 RepID=A0A8H6S481_9AGAR|nr:uncharacterized protein MIND_01185500 [Mycena indigotica]KAF7292865.1 hypothetical protein MIND_01185500 [Mycena indigotica]
MSYSHQQQRLEPLRRADVDPTCSRQRAHSSSRSKSRSRTESTHSSRHAPQPMPPMPAMPTMQPASHHSSHSRTHLQPHSNDDESLRSAFDDDSDDEVARVEKPRSKKGSFFGIFKSKKDHPKAPSQQYLAEAHAAAQAKAQKGLRRRSRSVGSFDVHPTLYYSRYAPVPIANIYGNEQATRSTNALSPQRAQPTTPQGRSRLHLAVPSPLSLGQSNGRTDTKNTFSKSCTLTKSRDPNDPDLPNDYNHPWFYRNMQEARAAEQRQAQDFEQRRAREAARPIPKRVNALPPDDVEPRRKRPEYFDQMAAPAQYRSR